MITILLATAGCVTDGSKTGSVSKQQTVVRQDGIYHTVGKGQTLWSIARRYDIRLETLLEANGIRDSGKVETGQLIFVPGKRQPQETQIIGEETEDFIWPVNGKVVSGFGESAGPSVSKGIVIQPAVSSAVMAARSGTVAFFSEQFLDLGKTLIIEHPDGFWTVYGGAGEVFVKPGEVIRRGQTIAKAGSTSNEKKTMLYFEIRQGHTAKNPRFYLP